MKTLNVTDTDNRDTDTTTLILDDIYEVDVNPWELLSNIIENNVENSDRYLKQIEKIRTKIEELQG